jgi:DNA invertase Pin-like site-specific DNA recombinase
MIYGYARVSTDGQSVDAQIAALTAAGAGRVYREVASGAKTDRAQLRRVLDQLDAGDVLMVTRLDRLARIIHRGGVRSGDAAERGVVFRGVGDAGSRGLRFRRGVRSGADGPVVHGGSLAMRPASMAKPIW